MHIIMNTTHIPVPVNKAAFEPPKSLITGNIKAPRVLPANAIIPIKPVLNLEHSISCSITQLYEYVSTIV